MIEIQCKWKQPNQRMHRTRRERFGSRSDVSGAGSVILFVRRQLETCTGVDHEYESHGSNNESTGLRCCRWGAWGAGDSYRANAKATAAATRGCSESWERQHRFYWAFLRFRKMGAGCGFPNFTPNPRSVAPALLRASGRQLRHHTAARLP